MFKGDPVNKLFAVYCPSRPDMTCDNIKLTFSLERLRAKRTFVVEKHEDACSG